MAENEPKQTSKEQVKQLTDRLSEGVKELFASGKYADYLKSLPTMRRYSSRNALLIQMQDPNATLVAGYQAWQSKYGRYVRQGERGIKILAPSPFTVKEEQQRVDPLTRQPIIGEDGLPETEVVERKLARFKVVTVFDVKQTDGKPLPSLAEDLTGDVRNYELFLESLRMLSPLPIIFENLPPDTDGVCRFGRHIAIREGMSEVQTLSAIIHEITHAKLHDKSLQNENDPAKDENTKEVESESVSYAVCQNYGIETGANSFGYVAAWSRSRDLKELNASLDTIHNTVAEFIDSIDANFRRLAKGRGVDLSIAAETPVKAPEPFTHETTPAAADTPSKVYEFYSGRIVDAVARDTLYTAVIAGGADEETAKVSCNAAVQRAVMGLLMESTDHLRLYSQYMNNPAFKTSIEDYAFIKTCLEPKGAIKEAAEPENAEDTRVNTSARGNYEKFSEMFPRIADGEYRYMRLEAGAGMEPLSLEWIDSDQISIMHYYTMNGDLMYDPMITLEIDNDAKTIRAVEFEQSNPQLYQRIDGDGTGRSIDGNGNERIITGLQARIDSFVSQWLSNISVQGYLPVRAIKMVDGEDVAVAFDSAGNPLNPDKAPEDQPAPEQAAQEAAPAGDKNVILDKPIDDAPRIGAFVLMPLVFDSKGQFERSGKRTKMKIEPLIGKYQVYSREEGGRAEGYLPTESGRLIRAGEYERVKDVTEAKIDDYFMRLRENAEKDFKNPDAWVDYNAAAAVNRLDEAEAHNGPVRGTREAKYERDRQESAGRRDAERREKEASFNAKVDEINAGIMRGDRVNAEVDHYMDKNPLFTLFDKHNISLLPATKGWVSRNLKAFQFQKDGRITIWGPRGMKASETFCHALHELKTAVSASMEQQREKDAAHPAAKEYDISYGHMGNGLTVWNRMEEKGGDYVTVAHIAPDRSVTYYDKDIPDGVKAKIEDVAMYSDARVSESQPEKHVFNSPPKDYTLEYHDTPVYGVDVYNGRKEPLAHIADTGAVKYTGIDIPPAVIEDIETYAKERADKHEAGFLNSDGDAYGIYLYNPDSGNSGVNKENYYLARYRPLQEGDTLDTLREEFSKHPPACDYFPRENGPDFGPGDVIVIKQGGEITAWYVDQEAFSRLNGFLDPTALTQETAPVEKTVQESEEPAQDTVLMPDPAIGLSERDLFGYRDNEMLPLTKDRAMELFDSNHTIYRLNPDNTEAMVFGADEIPAHDGLFGIERGEWLASPEYGQMIKAKADMERSRESDLLYGAANSFGIYQLKSDAPRDYRWASIGELNAQNLSVDRANYELVYTASLDIRDTLTNVNKIFDDYNRRPPEDFTGHSPSVSDVIVLQWKGKVSAHYVDRIGFVELPAFTRAEGAREQADLRIIPATNYTSSQLGNMMVTKQTALDAPKNDETGVNRQENSLIVGAAANSLPTVAELSAKAGVGEKISVLALLEAVKREQGQAATTKSTAVIKDTPDSRHTERGIE